MKGIQMSFPADWFLKSCSVSAKTSRDEVTEEAEVPSFCPSFLLPVPDGVASDVPEFCLQGHSWWGSHLSFKSGAWICVALITDSFAMV